MVCAPFLHKPKITIFLYSYIEQTRQFLCFDPTNGPTTSLKPSASSTDKIKQYIQRIIFNRNLIKKSQQQSATESLKGNSLRTLLNNQTRQLYEKAIEDAKYGCQQQSRRLWEEYVVFLKTLKPPGDVRFAFESMLKVSIIN